MRDKKQINMPCSHVNLVAIDDFAPLVIALVRRALLT